MGSINPPPSASSEIEEITILVTGFAPFRTQNPINPAWEIARSLPPYLPQSTHSHPARNPAADNITSNSTRSPKVKILVYPEPIKVSYEAVRELVPRLWSEDLDGSRGVKGEEGEHGVEENKRNNIDYMIHIGMATGRKWYSVERKGHRDGYILKDVDGKMCEDTLRRVREAGKPVKNVNLDGKVEEDVEKDAEKEVQNEEEKWIWEGLPTEIKTDVDVDDVWKRWRISLPDYDLRVSEDAGHYLCDFIFYSSLAELTKRDEKKRVLFLHVPVESDEETIRKGVEITCELIRGLVASERLKILVEKAGR